MIFRTLSILAFLELLMTESAGVQPLGMPGCQEFCGNVSIPYPFGIGAGCYMNKWFEVSCNETFTPPTTLPTSIEIEVLYFSLDSSFVAVKIPIIRRNLSTELKSVNFSGSPFISPLGSPLDTEEYVTDAFNWVITETQLDNAFVILDFKAILIYLLDVKSSAREEITKVAKLAYRCLSLSGRKRPKMIEVAAKLEQIPLSQNYSNGQQNHEEVRYVNTEVTNVWDGASTSTGSGLDSGVALSLDMES
ncbi:hypothetical protein SLEP1_g56299 [Rubroshorea leprosula]|uniref:Wall-associated receptor kinase galacturonan-binding domain-containing protein n=1 Tax=Rubroshorea leprosula TaxID=152421 RepID=A0AAV5MMA1_9ROSI|nr:hypothetical protein SLEP1_g56299 [Rubroshorea leprosula]